MKTAKSDVNSLLSKNCDTLHNILKRQNDLKFLGVYALAYTTKKLEGKKVKIGDIFYIGMSNSLAGVRGRLKQFIGSINGRQTHSAGMRLFRDYLNRVPFEDHVGDKRLWAIALTFKCNVRKADRQATDLRTMGRVTCLEYYLLAHYRAARNCEPELNLR